MSLNEPMQYDRPLFVTLTMKAQGRTFNAGDELKWKEIGLDKELVKILYREGRLRHSSTLEAETKVGDGLEVLDVDGLHNLVNGINEKVKSKTKSDAEFQKKKCKKSKIADKQRGLIRSWRRNYGHMETD
jgi:hypothetical protein